MLNNSQYAKIITDEVSSTVTYVGYAQTNFVATSDPLWQILKITSASGTSPAGVTTFQFADAPGDFTNIWDNRASLNYSS